MSRPRHHAPVLLTPALLAAALLGGCDDPPGGGADPPPAAVVDLLGGPAGYAAVADPAMVEAVRVMRIPPTPIPPGGDPPRTPTRPPWAADYTRGGGPVAVPAGRAAELSAALTADDWLTPDVAKGCMPVYGLKLRFTGKDDTPGADTVVEVWQCFACDTLAVATNGEPAGGDDSEALRGLLLKTARESFPNDDAFADLD